MVSPYVVWFLYHQRENVITSLHVFYCTCDIWYPCPWKNTSCIFLGIRHSCTPKWQKGMWRQKIFSCYYLVIQSCIQPQKLPYSKKLLSCYLHIYYRIRNYTADNNDLLLVASYSTTPESCFCNLNARGNKHRRNICKPSTLHWLNFAHYLLLWYLPPP